MVEDIDILDEIAKIKGFKGRKKVEKVGKKIIIHDISPKATWAEHHAKELGFSGKKKGERIDGKIVEKDVSPITEFVEYMKKKTGKKPENIYLALIPEDEITEGLKIMEERWLVIHEKFIEFCKELAEGIYKYYESKKTNVAAITMEQMLDTMEEYHRTHPGSMNIYSRDELIIGLSYCLPGRGINARVSANKRAITFEAIPVIKT